MSIKYRFRKGIEGLNRETMCASLVSLLLETVLDLKKAHQIRVDNIQMFFIVQ